MRRLDRILVNDEGLSAWLNMRVNVLPPGISDHSPIPVYPSYQRRQRVVSFHFFNHWVEESSFMDVVSSIWTRDTRFSSVVSLVKNLRNLKSILRSHFGKHIQTISEDVLLAKDTMDRAQREVEVNPPSEELSNQASLATVNFWRVVRVEEADMHQKSRIRWLKLGDHNTTFFH